MTFTCYNWLPLIEITNSYDLVYNWFDILKKQGHFLTGMLLCPIMYMLPLHLVKQKKSINTINGDGKRFIGYEIVNRLKAQDRHD